MYGNELFFLFGTTRKRCFVVCLDIMLLYVAFQRRILRIFSVYDIPIHNVISNQIQLKSFNPLHKNVYCWSDRQCLPRRAAYRGSIKNKCAEFDCIYISTTHNIHSISVVVHR